MFTPKRCKLSSLYMCVYIIKCFIRDEVAISFYYIISVDTLGNRQQHNLTTKLRSKMHLSSVVIIATQSPYSGSIPFPVEFYEVSLCSTVDFFRLLMTEKKFRRIISLITEPVTLQIEKRWTRLKGQFTPLKERTLITHL